MSSKTASASTAAGVSQPSRADGPGQFAHFDRKMITTFEVITTHFVDVVFNHIYRGAATAVSQAKDGSSLTDEYRNRIQAYLTGVKTDETGFRDTMANLHRYYSTFYPSFSYASFVDSVVAHFVPADYFGMLKMSDRDEMMSSIVCDLVTSLGVYATTPDMLHRIIDQHQAAHQVTTRMMQDHGITSLLGKRDTIRNQFLKRVGQARETVSMDVVEDMKKALRKLAKEGVGMKTIIKSAFDKIKAQDATIRDYKQREAKFRKLIEHLRAAASPDPARLANRIHSARLPRANTIGEDPLEPDDPVAPDPDTVGEDDEAREQRPSRGARPGKPAPVISKSFFKTTPLRPAGNPRDSKRETKRVTPADLRPATRPAPAEDPEEDEPEPDEPEEDTADTEMATESPLTTTDAPEDDGEPLTLLLGGVRRTGAADT